MVRVNNVRRGVGDAIRRFRHRTSRRRRFEAASGLVAAPTDRDRVTDVRGQDVRTVPAVSDGGVRGHRGGDRNRRHVAPSRVIVDGRVFTVTTGSCIEPEPTTSKPLQWSKHKCDDGSALSSFQVLKGWCMAGIYCYENMENTTKISFFLSHVPLYDLNRQILQQY